MMSPLLRIVYAVLDQREIDICIFVKQINIYVNVDMLLAITIAFSYQGWQDREALVACG